MKPILLPVFILVQAALYGQLSWVQKDSLPSLGRYNHVSFVIGNHGYAGLGAVNAEQRIYSPTLFRYDPSEDNWVQLADFPGGGRYGSTAFTINGRGYICLGVDNSHNMHSDVWEFNPETGAWTEKSDFAGGNRYSACSFVIGNKAYVIGGSINDGNNYLNDVWCYTPETDTWTQKTSLPAAHKSCAVAFSINGKGYVAGGSSSTMSPEKDFYEYDPSTDSWNRLPDMPEPRTGAVAFVMGDTAYVGTGWNNYVTRKTFVAYSLTANSWSAMPVPPQDFSERVFSTAFVIGNTGYVIGGRTDPYDPFYGSGEMLQDLWAYTPCILPVPRYTYLVNNTVATFADSSTGATSYHWNFGDGTFSDEKNPVHTFTNGVFNVCQVVSNGCGSDSTCKSVQINCTPPVSRFFSSYGYPEAQFTDSSVTGWLISRRWDFGDNTTSTDLNPLHVYNSPGTYQVCLTVTDSCGTDTHCENIYMLLPLTLNISVTPSATNDLKAEFSDLTPGTTYWKWKFGDGDSAAVQNPSHLYREYGTYVVCLTAGNSTSAGTLCRDELISVNPLLHMTTPVSVYPNPSTGRLFLRFYKTFSVSDVYVEDQYGRHVYRRHISSPGLTAPAEVDLSGLSAGIYFVHVNCDSYSKVWKIILR